MMTELADGGERLPDGREERPDTGTDEEYAVFRVVNNVGNVLRGQGGNSLCAGRRPS